MQKDIVLINAGVKVKENTLLNGEKLKRLTDSAGFDEALEIINEYGYSNTAGEYERVLREAKTEAAAFLRDVCLPGYGLECFLITNDYQNAKVFVKSKYAKNREGEVVASPSALESRGFLHLAALRGGIKNVNYTAFSPELSGALIQIDDEFAKGKGSPGLISVVLDKAMYGEIFRMLKASRNAKEVAEYFRTKADFANIETFLRCKRFGLDAGFYRQCLVEGGKVKTRALSECYESNSLSLLLTGTPYEKFARTPYSGDLTLFETGRDNFLLNIFRINRADLFSPAPVAGYYLARLTEIKMLDIIMTAKKNVLEKGELDKRIREMYFE